MKHTEESTVAILDSPQLVTWLDLLFWWFFQLT